MAAPNVSIREHRIPSAGSGPYICVEGPTAACGSARAAPERSAGSIRRPAPSRNSRCPIPRRRRSASPSAPTAISGSAQKAANKIGRITLKGEIAEFPLPTPKAGPDGMILGPDGNVWFSETEVSQIGRITPQGDDHRIQGRHLARRAAAVDHGARRRALVQRSRRQPHRPHHHRRQGDRVSDPEPRQPAARDDHPSRRLDLVRGDQHQRARPHRPRRQDHRASGADAELVAARRHRRARRQSLVHRECRQQDRLHDAEGRSARRISDPDAGERRALHRVDVRRPAVSSRNGMPG